MDVSLAAGPERTRGRAVSTFLKRFASNRLSVVGACMLIAIALIAVVGPALYRTSPFSAASSPFIPPGGAHPLGTDNLGHDLLAQTIAGARTSLLVGVAATAISLFIGLVVGTLSGYYRGWVDQVLMRVTEIFLVLPRFFVALIAVAFLGANEALVTLVIGLLAWPEIARLLRAEFLSIHSRPFVSAAISFGAGDRWLILREILPNALPPVVVIAALQVASAILLEAGLSFLGLGDPTVVSWGTMLSRAENFFFNAWWMAVFPGIAILLTTLGVYLIADGVNDALNPRVAND